MQVSKVNLFAFVIVAYLTARILIDGIYSGEKPAFILFLYIVFSYLLSFFLILKGNSRKNNSIIGFMIFLFISLNVSMFYSEVPINDYLKFSLQVYTPCLFLLATIYKPQVMQKAAVLFSRYVAIPSLLFLVLMIYKIYLSENVSGISAYEFYQNSPNHVIAQTVLKLSFVVMTSGVAWLLLSSFLLFFINVRSVILAYVLSLVFLFRERFLTKRFMKKFILYGLPFLLLFAFSLDWADIYNRLVFKGRDIGSYNQLEVATSGRTEIFSFYISYIINNFSLINWLFGEGPIWLAEGGPRLSAHNDLLNVVVSFGLVGLFVLLTAYYKFYKALSRNGKVIFAISFAVLLATNGVVFHQSNVLFALLYFYSANVDMKTSHV